MYLWIFEDGSMQQTAEEPDDNAYRSVDLGILTLVKFDIEDGRYYQCSDNGLEDIDEM